MRSASLPNLVLVRPFAFALPSIGFASPFGGPFAPVLILDALIAILDPTVGGPPRVLHFLLVEAKALQRLAEALAVLQTGEERRGRDVGSARAEVVRQDVGRHEVPAAQPGVRYPGTLERQLQRVGRRVELRRN